MKYLSTSIITALAAITPCLAEITVAPEQHTVVGSDIGPGPEEDKTLSRYNIVYDEVPLTTIFKNFEKQMNYAIQVKVQDTASHLVTMSLEDEHITTIFDAVENRVAPEEIEENDYNLNITRYVDTFEEEEEIDIEANLRELAEVDAELQKLEAEMAEHLERLGIRGGNKDSGSNG